MRAKKLGKLPRCPLLLSVSYSYALFCFLFCFTNRDFHTRHWRIVVRDKYRYDCLGLLPLAIALRAVCQRFSCGLQAIRSRFACDMLGEKVPCFKHVLTITKELNILKCTLSFTLKENSCDLITIYKRQLICK